MDNDIKFLIGRYIVSCRLENSVFLPASKGWTFQSAFENALRKVVCNLRLNECTRCLLRSICVYTRVFRYKSLTPAERKEIDYTCPFIIETPLAGKGVCNRGERFALNLTLIGQANEYIPYFIYALSRMGEKGIGINPEGGKSCFIIETIRHNERIIYHHDNKHNKLEIIPEEIRYEYPTATRLTAPMEVSFITPTFIKRHRNRIGKIDFRALIEEACLRIATVSSLYGIGKSSFDCQELLALSAQVRTEDAELEWRKVNLTSPSDMGVSSYRGFVGRAVYTGRLETFVPVMNLARILHIGANSCYGMGRIDFRMLF